MKKRAIPLGTELLYMEMTRAMVVTVNGRIRVIGPFDNEEQAIAAGEKCAEELATEPNPR